MDKKLKALYTAILKNELIVAMGCTEPIAIAYAGAKAREVLGCMPEHCDIQCSGNIIKNVKGVIVPHSGGRHGIAIAAILGILGGDASQQLGVLQSVTPENAEIAVRLKSEGFCSCSLAKDVENLFIDLTVTKGQESARVQIKNNHTGITLIEKNGKVLYSEQVNTLDENEGKIDLDFSALNLHDILEFGRSADITEVMPSIERQIEFNQKISTAGLTDDWGACVGKTLLQCNQDLPTRACAAAAAGSDARMAGCPLPVVINSGSGNQGITITMPLLEYAKANHIPHEQVCRALCVANLISIHQKDRLGSLSAYCGVVCASSSSICGVAFMLGDSDEVIERTITNTICTIGGIVCDGAKSSCAAKIAASVRAAIIGWEMARRGHVFQADTGLVGMNVEDTIDRVGRMGREGMRSTDQEILQIMLGK